MARRSWGRIMKIPDPAVHPGIGRKFSGRADPVQRDQLLLQFFFGNIGLIGAGETSHDMPLGIQNFQRDR